MRRFNLFGRLRRGKARPKPPLSKPRPRKIPISKERLAEIRGVGLEVECKLRKIAETAGSRVPSIFRQELELLSRQLTEQLAGRQPTSLSQQLTEQLAGRQPTSVGELQTLIEERLMLGVEKKWIELTNFLVEPRTLAKLHAAGVKSASLTITREDLNDFVMWKISGALLEPADSTARRKGELK